MQSISTDINVPLALLDLDVLAGATQRSVVYANAEGTKACSVELRVTLLGASPVNLVVRYLGQNSTPAADPTRLLALDVKVPDTSALSAAYAGVFILPVFTPFAQLEVQNVSGGNVHVQAFVQGCDADFVDAPGAAAGSASLVQLAAGSAVVGHVIVDSQGSALPAGANTIGAVGLTGTLAAALLADLDLLAGAIASGSIKALLQASSAVIGHVIVDTLPSLVLAAGTAAIGKLGANAGVNIGTVDVTAYATYIDTVAAADTTAHAYGTSQVIKAPAFVRAQRGMLGTVTISDGTRAGMVLTGGDAMPFHGTNLNQLTYQFSQTGATTEKFSISVGI